jgi:voltage-gated potassium channel
MPAKLYNPPRPASLRQLLFRVLIVLGLVSASILVLALERTQLIDHSTGKPPDIFGIIYFAMVTITTVGYGDIVPQTTFARMVDTLFLVPVRFIVLATFIGTAYQLVLQRFQESYRMHRAVQQLRDHVIVCEYGQAGRSAVEELLLQGTAPEQIVLLSENKAALDEVDSMGVVAVEGDPGREVDLRSVAIERARHVIICPDRDDTAVLIALTAHDLNPEAQLIAVCRRQENVKLLERSGAHVIVSPSSAGGKLLAAATRQAHLVDTMQDILSVGGGLQLDERPALAHEVGQDPRVFEDIAVVRVYRAGRRYNVGGLPVLEKGDTIVYVRVGDGRKDEQPRRAAAEE